MALVVRSESARRFEALIFDWDGTAVPDRGADASEVRALVEQLCAKGSHIAVVSGTHLDNVDGQLRARPAGPGRLFFALNRGSELFAVDTSGPQVISRRQATAEEDAALTRAAEKIVNRLRARGLETRVVSQRLNRRKIDLIPTPEWADPPKAMIDRLLDAVEVRVRDAGFRGIVDVARLAAEIARQEGLASPKITSDAKHLEVGLTDKGDSARELLAVLWTLGIAPVQVCIGGDEFGPLGGMPGSDALMLVPEAGDALAISVGVEPNGVPNGVVHLGGGPQAFLEFLEDQLRRRSDVPTVAACDGWSVVVDGEIDPDAERVHDAVLTIAGGMIGTTGAPLLAHPAAQPDVIAAGIYDGEGPTTDLLPAPRWAFLDGVLAPTDRVRRVLDLHSATLGEDVEGKTRLRSLRFASLARPGIVALRADVDPPDASSSPLAPPPAGHAHGDGRGRHWIATHGTGGSVTAAGVQQHDGSRLERLVAYVTGPDGPLPDVAVSRLRDAEDAGFEQLLAEHREAWGARWTRADVRIEGDPLLQRAIRFGLYHMMSSVGDVGEVAMGARGVTGRAYRGHVFWDADLFVLPFLAATHAASARAMLEYRIRRLPAALQRAAGEGRAGARFPWESAGTGFDVTPTAGRDQSGRVVPIRTGEDEVHIVGDVAWATCCYIDWTGDEKFAADVGLELLVETARYWATRIRIDETGHGHIFGVIGPDEYHEPVDDNAYTNVLARWNLRRAADSVERYGHGDVADAEFQSWRDRASSLVDGYDPATNVYEQFAGFFALEPLRIADVAPRRPIAADLLLGRDRVRAAQVVKQPDVLMLHHLLPDELAPGALVPDLDFYDPRTAHGSSLSPGIHASVLARANRIDDAVAALRLAASIDLDDLSESGAGGVHLGAMGSSWQALAFGFMGLAPRRDALRLDPRLPKQWDSLTVNVVYHGTPVCIRVDREAVYVTSSAPLTVDLDDRRLHCDAGETTVSRSQGGNI